VMVNLGVRKVLIVMAHAGVGWALCFATIGIGQAVTSLQAALIVHAIGAPLYFAAVSAVYFTRFGYTSPLQTAVAFTGFVMVVDFALVAVVVLHSLAMFASPLGTWIPFALIFAATWLTGVLVTGRHTRRPDVRRPRVRGGAGTDHVSR
jgi:hypothetical protein